MLKYSRLPLLIVSLLITSLFGTSLLTAPGCGSAELEGGAPCELSTAGAAKCRSNICLELDCATGKKQTICAGERCEGPVDCDDPTQSCVITKRGTAFCLPRSPCN